MAVNISGLPQITSNKAKGPRYMNTISFIEKLEIIRQRAGQFYDLPVGMLLILFSLIFYIYGQIPLSESSYECPMSNTTYSLTKIGS